MISVNTVCAPRSLPVLRSQGFGFTHSRLFRVTQGPWFLFTSPGLSECSPFVTSPLLLRCHRVSLMNLSLCLLCSSFPRHVGLGPTLIQNDLILNRLHQQQPCFPIRSNPQALKVRTSVQPTCRCRGRREIEQLTDIKYKT